MKKLPLNPIRHRNQMGCCSTLENAKTITIIFVFVFAFAELLSLVPRIYLVILIYLTKLSFLNHVCHANLHQVGVGYTQVGNTPPAVLS